MKLINFLLITKKNIGRLHLLLPKANKACAWSSSNVTAVALRSFNFRFYVPILGAYKIILYALFSMFKLYYLYSIYPRVGINELKVEIKLKR